MNWLKELAKPHCRCRQRIFNHIKRVQLLHSCVSLSYDLISLHFIWQLLFSRMCLSIQVIHCFIWVICDCIQCSLFPILALCFVLQLTIWIANAIEWKELSWIFVMKTIVIFSLVMIHSIVHIRNVSLISLVDSSILMLKNKYIFPSVSILNWNFFSESWFFIV